MTKTKIDDLLEFPKDVQVNINDEILTFKGIKGEVSRNFRDKDISIKKEEEEKLRITCGKATKREKARLYSYKAHIKNMVKGVMEGHTYQLKICSSHFPVNVSINNNELIVKNFLGEKVPRRLRIKDRGTVKIDGSVIIVDAISKETAGQIAADIEQLCRITNRDRRVFQDGIYITNKDGKEVK